MAGSRVSAPWYGGLVTAVNFVGAAWLLVYTLLPVRPLQALGGWNYVAVAGLVPVQAILMTRWRGHPYQRPVARANEDPGHPM
jgi:Cell division protein CrgA